MKELKALRKGLYPGEIQRAPTLGYKGTSSYIWHACPGCGKERWVIFRAKTGKPAWTLCQSCAQQKHGRRRVGTLYRLAKLDRNDFFYPMAVHDGYVKEHRLIMAKHLGRILHPWEHVHHKNGVKTDNRLTNLQLVDAHYHGITHRETIIYSKLLENEIKRLKKQIRLLSAAT